MERNQPPSDQVQVECKCRECGQTVRFTVPRQHFRQRAKGGTVREIYTDLPEHHLKTLETQLCRDCQTQTGT